MNELKSTSDLEGQKFTIAFKGLGNWTFAKCILDIANGTMFFSERKGSPHVYFNDTYASIQSYSKHEIIFSRDMIGNVNYPATTADVQLSIGDIITLHHVEGDFRLDVFNDTQEIPVKVSTTDISWQITEQGLVSVEKPHNPYPTANIRGNVFDWNIFNGVEQKLINVDLDVMLAEITFNFYTGYMNLDSHDICLSLRLEDEFGDLVYHRDIYGDREIIEQSILLPFYEGYELSISNDFWASSQIVNSETQVVTVISHQKFTVANVDKGLFSAEE